MRTEERKGLLAIHAEADMLAASAATAHHAEPKLMEQNARPIRIDPAQVDELLASLEAQAKGVFVGVLPPPGTKEEDHRMIAREFVQVRFKGKNLRTKPLPVIVLVVKRLDVMGYYMHPPIDSIVLHALMSPTGRLKWPDDIRSTLLHELTHAADPSYRKISHTGRSYSGKERKALKTPAGKFYVLKLGKHASVGRIEVRASMAEAVAHLAPLIEDRLVQMASRGDTLTTGQYNDMFRSMLIAAQKQNVWPHLATASKHFEKELAEFVKGVWTGVEDELAKWVTDDGRALKEVVISDEEQEMSDFDRELAEALSGRRYVTSQALTDTYAKRHRR